MCWSTSKPEMYRRLCELVAITGLTFLVNQVADLSSCPWQTVRAVSQSDLLKPRAWSFDTCHAAQNIRIKLSHVRNNTINATNTLFENHNNATSIYHSINILPKATKNSYAVSVFQTCTSNRSHSLLNIYSTNQCRWHSLAAMRGRHSEAAAA